MSLASKRERKCVRFMGNCVHSHKNKLITNIIANIINRPNLQCVIENVTSVISIPLWNFSNHMKKNPRPD